MKNINKVLDILAETYPDAKCELDYTTPFELLVATILSAQCTDVRVNKVTGEMFKKYNTPEDFAKLSIKEIQEEICLAIEQVYETISKMDYNAFILLIGRSEIQQGLKAIVGTDCVIEYMMDVYFDETRSQHYLNYLNKNYSKDGYDYPYEYAVEDITTELTIYSQMWDSEYFMKSLFRIGAIITGKGYLWDKVLPTKNVHINFRDNVITPLKDHGMKLGDILEKAYHSSIYPF